MQCSFQLHLGSTYKAGGVFPLWSISQESLDRIRPKSGWIDQSHAYMALASSEQPSHGMVCIHWLSLARSDGLRTEKYYGPWKVVILGKHGKYSA